MLKSTLLRTLHGSFQQVRRLHLHEYESLGLMKHYGLPTPRFAVAGAPEDIMPMFQAGGCFSSMDKKDVVVKAQVLTGGRGLGYFKETNLQGGVHIASTAQQAREISKKMLNQTLITKQTGLSKGLLCSKVLLAERLDIQRERYISFVLDSKLSSILLIGSSKGGSSIEDIASENKGSIQKLPIDALDDLDDERLYDFVKGLDLCSDLIEPAMKTLHQLYQLFKEKDCILLEVNPFVETKKKQLFICDAKMTVDDNASFRQAELFQKRQDTEEDYYEREAKRIGLNYVSLNGSIGCIVNGAGLAMATMDLLALHGGKPANFLDVGGGAEFSQIIEALRLLQHNTNVEAILINIFGGIMRCDVIAQGILQASQQMHLTKRLVVRLEGTNKQEAQRLLRDVPGLSLIFEDDFNRAAQKVVSLVVNG